ncbi:MAG: hypothetical protein SVU24_06375 [Pseudomonadota bacterium]|nr:hypothetical protein [Pseudomonadota bacterium]
MNKTINGSYDNHDQARNAWEDLIAIGIPREKVYIDEEAKVVKVIMPQETEAEIREIFERHGLNCL